MGSVRTGLRIRRATTADVEALMRMAVRFLAESAYRSRVPANVEQLGRLVGFLLEHGAIFVADNGAAVVGMLALYITPNHLSGELGSSEVAFWIDPERRGGTTAVRMLEAGKAWAREQGAATFQLISPAGAGDVARFYERLGFEELETVWQIRLAA